MEVREFNSCPAACDGSADGFWPVPYRACSWGVQCGDGKNCGPQVADCPRFEKPDRSGAVCPHCFYDGRLVRLRRDLETGVVACPHPECESGWFENDKEMMEAFEEVMGWLREERDKALEAQATAEGQRDQARALAQEMELRATGLVVRTSLLLMGVYSRPRATPAGSILSRAMAVHAGSVLATGPEVMGGGAA